MINFSDDYAFFSQTHKVVVFVTAGKGRPNTLSTYLHFQNILESGVKIFVVTIGAEAMVDDYKHMVEREADILPLERFRELNMKAPTIARYIAKSKLFKIFSNRRFTLWFKPFL